MFSLTLIQAAYYTLFYLCGGSSPIFSVDTVYETVTQAICARTH